VPAGPDAGFGLEGPAGIPDASRLMRPLLALLASVLVVPTAGAQELRGLPPEPELLVVLNLEPEFRIERSGAALYERLMALTRNGAGQSADPAALAATRQAWADELGLDIRRPFRSAAVSLEGLRTVVTGGPRHFVFVAEGDFRAARFAAYAAKRGIPQRTIAGRNVWGYVDWIKGGATEAQRAEIDTNLRRMPMLANIVFFVHADRRLVACEAGDLPTVTARAEGQSPSFRFDAVTAADRAALPKPALTVRLEGRAFQAQVLGQPEKIARLTLHAGEDAQDEIVRLRGDFTSEAFAQQAAGQLQAGLAAAPTLFAAQPTDSAEDARMKTALRALVQGVSPVNRQERAVTAELRLKDSVLLEFLAMALEQTAKDRGTPPIAPRK